MRPFRSCLLAAAQDADARLPGAAARVFEQAGFGRHAADDELELARTLMQQGHYRRALAFAAHAALAHPDVAANAALYAWLLHVGGQSRVARDVIAKARARLPESLLLAWVARTLDAPAVAAPVPPEIHGLRLAPNSARSVAVAGGATSGVIVGDGTRVLVPAHRLRDASRNLLVRDGLGHVYPARVVREDVHGVGELAVPGPAACAASVSPARDPVPGSPVSLIGFAHGSREAWPHLVVAIPGLPRTGADPHRLRIALSGLVAGAAVFDRAGRLAGLVGESSDGDPVIIPPSTLFSGNDIVRSMRREPGPGEPLEIDAVYERAMGCVVQILAGWRA